MSPISIKLFRSAPNPVEINGPILSFIQQPVSVAQTSGGSVTFVGIATASFPNTTPPIPNKNLGQILYQWYEVGIGSISGANSTTLTLPNLRTPTDSGRKFYLESRYIPSSYTPGIDLITPRAINSPLNSDIVQVTVYPQISITTQPQSQSAAIDNPATFSVQGSLTDSTQGSISYQWQINETNLSNGTVSLGSTTLTVSGANTQTLTISSNTVGINSIRAVLTHPVAGNSPFYSNAVEFNAVEPRSIIKIEGYNEGEPTAFISEINVDDEELVINSDSYNYDWICLYASEKDIEIEMDVYAAKGNDVGSFVGGEGGYSRISFTMQKNDEYIVTGIKENDGLFIYRKASLIAVVGSGGDAGISGNGGPGGGVNLAGSAAPSGSQGGSLIPAGQLTLSGVFGSIVPTTTTTYSGDSIAASPNGGQVIPCTKGVYWRDQGKSPCQDLGLIKFRLSDGTELSNSAQINRGFKAGYNITQTGGRRTVIGGGNGGTGATGGSGSTNNFGAGGGSGYSDGTVDIISSTIGGSLGRSRINLRPSLGNFYIDSQGRILIFALSTPGFNPNELTKTNGIVLPGTNTCIDDVRWQNFLSLAQTENYRMGVTTADFVPIIKAQENNIRKQINGNRKSISTSLTSWPLIPGTLYANQFSWDENSGYEGVGLDYSGTVWNNRASSGLYSTGFAFYGESNNPPWVGATYHFPTLYIWILPPGVPDFL